MAWSAVCCASESTRAAVSMLSSTGWCIRSIIMGSGRRSCGGSGTYASCLVSDNGELSAGMLGFPPPRKTSASFARSSSFSWISRSSSASTSSRKASTSSSSYPGRNLVVLNCLFRTSAGVSGILSPRRAWLCSSAPYLKSTVHGLQTRYSYLKQNQYHNEQHHEAEVHGYCTEPKRR